MLTKLRYLKSDTPAFRLTPNYMISELLLPTNHIAVGDFLISYKKKDIRGLPFATFEQEVLPTAPQGGWNEILVLSKPFPRNLLQAGVQVML